MPADPRFIPGLGKTHQRVPEIHIDDYPGPKEPTKGHYVEVTATLMSDGSVTEAAHKPRMRRDFRILPAQLESEVFPLVNPDTDLDGAAGYPQPMLNTFAAAVQAGQMPLALMQIALASYVRKLQRAHYDAIDNPPPAPGPAPE